MAQVTKEAAGTFLAGRTLIQQSGKIGGAKHVFVRFDDNYSDLLPFPFGGRIMNAPKGAFRFFAGDLFYMEYDAKTENPKLYMLKTYEVVSASGTTVNIVRDGYKHIPFVGDVLTIAPATIGGKGEALTVIGVTETTVTDKGNVWALTLAKAPTTAPKEGDVLVEADTDGNMVVKNINAWADQDLTFSYNPSASGDSMTDFESAKYFYTPVVAATAYIHKMSPLPQCVLDLNSANVNGWFRIDARVKPTVLAQK
jgi:hypothetical protein